ncbi:Rhodanese-like protein [Thalassoporum mexicanum PCC 7367]|uniref:rhodanese-like domain-containing protein n=1 Tax=Thalassoporum mexicanum TaxID=3457544 RepID=UPI00029FF1B4|nr:rhodanese-like domain-containing protein [Pseudanabaena sp. PCC 7367]AFY71716.1 Rhodanese-like protein [Pseudanabaena sp. PCC 7367]
MSKSNPDRRSEKQVWRYLVVALLCILGLSMGAMAVVAKSTRLDLWTYLNSRTHKTITVQELQQGLVEPLVLIDVRSPQEYAEDHILGSVLVPIDEIESGDGVQQIQAIVEQSLGAGQPQPTVVLYCRTGPRSHRAYAKLSKAADFNFVVLEGGITAWRETVQAGL